MNKYGKEWERLVNAIPEYPAPEIHTLAEVCDILRITRSTAHRMIKRGELRTFHLGRHHRVTSLELERIMAIQGIYASQRKKT